LDAGERIGADLQRVAAGLLVGADDRALRRERLQRCAAAEMGVEEDAQHVAILVLGDEERAVLRDEHVDGGALGILAVSALLPAADDIHRLAGARHTLLVDGHEHEAMAVLSIAVERDDELVLVRRREHAAGVERHAERRDVTGQEQRRILVMRAVYTPAILGVGRAVVDAVGPAVVRALGDDVELLVREVAFLVGERGIELVEPSASSGTSRVATCGPLWFAVKSGVSRLFSRLRPSGWSRRIRIVPGNFSPATTERPQFTRS
jgi:hypothetical protein